MELIRELYCTRVEQCSNVWCRGHIYVPGRREEGIHGKNGIGCAGGRGRRDRARASNLYAVDWFSMQSYMAQNTD